MSRPRTGTFWCVDRGRRDSARGNTGTGDVWRDWKGLLTERSPSGHLDNRWAFLLVWGPGISKFFLICAWSHLTSQQPRGRKRCPHEPIDKAGDSHTSQQVPALRHHQGWNHPPWQAESCSHYNFADFQPQILDKPNASVNLDLGGKWKHFLNLCQLLKAHHWKLPLLP